MARAKQTNDELGRRDMTTGSSCVAPRFRMDAPRLLSDAHAVSKAKTKPTKPSKGQPYQGQKQLSYAARTPHRGSYKFRGKRQTRAISYTENPDGSITVRLENGQNLHVKAKDQDAIKTVEGLKPSGPKFYGGGKPVPLKKDAQAEDRFELVKGGETYVHFSNYIEDNPFATRRRDYIHEVSAAVSHYEDTFTLIQRRGSLLRLLRDRLDSLQAKEIVSDLKTSEARISANFDEAMRIIERIAG